MDKVLIVEDEDILRDVYVSVFTMEHFEVSEAQNGKIALDAIEKYKPDVVVLDVMMPVMTGIEFLEKANVIKKFPKTKFLVLTNLSDRETIDKVMSLGATKHMIKSNVSPGELVATVRAMLA